MTPSTRRTASIRTLAVASVAVTVVLLGACGGGPNRASNADSSSLPLPEECEEGSASIACRFVVAVQRNDLDALSEGERAVARSGEPLADGDWRLDSCELAGDVTVACRLLFSQEPSPVDLYIGPVNGEYVDGIVIVPPGEEVRYEVVGYEVDVKTSN